MHVCGVIAKFYVNDIVNTVTEGDPFSPLSGFPSLNSLRTRCPMRGVS